MNIAFVIIDVQKAFVGHLKSEKIYEDTLAFINATSAQFRKANQPVIIVRDIEEGDDETFQNVDELMVDTKDIELTKTFNNSFWKTDLEKILKDKHIDFLVIAGNAAEHCITATFFGARERGFKVAMLQHGIFADREESLISIYYDRPLISYTVIQALLNK